MEMHLAIAGISYPFVHPLVVADMLISSLLAMSSDHKEEARSHPESYAKTVSFCTLHTAKKIQFL